ncbi:uncharacterized protein [Nicotiana tomentosiformis]|uniref:uncharacterized protein isoform X2 n=1 Tax=Nicotiana tomentosiformis TaxID=4098 RepID=UPI001448706B|nr:uncharacterized protein LOC117273626 isoform X2 [Nicotiana tomentosiformis]
METHQQADLRNNSQHTDILQPIASSESFVSGNENGKSYGSTNKCNEFETVNCSRSSQDKRKRKASMVGGRAYSSV